MAEIRGFGAQNGNKSENIIGHCRRGVKLWIQGYVYR